MKRALALLLLATGCKATTAPTEKPARAPIEVGPTVVDEKVSQQEALSSALKDQQLRYLAALADYEKGKVAFRTEIAAMMKKAHASARAVMQVEEMVVDGQRISNELIAATTALCDALVARAAAARKLLTADGRLCDVEWKEFGREKAQAEVAPQVQALRAHEKELHAAQKQEQDALAALDKKEQEVAAMASTATEASARDQADQQLADLRTALDASFQKLLAAQTVYDAAAQRIHTKLLDAAQADDPDTAAKLRGLLDDRAQAAAALSQARTQLKDATMKRADSRAQALGYDLELNRVLHDAFARPRQREEFLERIASGRSGSDAALAELSKEEQALGDLRRQIIAAETEAQALLW